MTMYSWAYRKFQQFMHKHDWHHMETSRPLPYRGTHHWCHWCGLRVTVPDPDPMLGYKALYDIAVASPRAGLYLTGIKDYTV
jgi:hypothetical protein